MLDVSRFAVLALLLAVAACGSTARETDYAAGSEVYRLPGVLTAEVHKLMVHPRPKIMLELTLKNEGTDTLGFWTKNVQLDYKGHNFPAKDWRGREYHVDIGPGETKPKYWAFHIEEDPTPGEYQLTVSDIEHGPEGKGTPVGKNLTITVKVPAAE